MSELNKVTPADLEAEIVVEEYHRLPNTNITVCVLTGITGCTTIGINYGSVDPANYNEQLGKELSRKQALDQWWPLLGFRLRDRLYAENQEAQLTYVDRMVLELAELQTKLDKLSAYLDRQAGLPNPPPHCEDLMLQREHMTSYANILAKRIKEAQ